MKYWRQWQRALHRVVLRRLRTPSRSHPDKIYERPTSAPWLSRIYEWIINKKRTKELHHAQRIVPSNIPVISVGNFTFGATGKTPCVMYMTEIILKLQKQCDGVPMLLTRGYGDDEWRMFAARFPSCKLAVGADRFRMSKQCIEAANSPISCVLIDDGLQQWRVVRDLDIVMIDALHAVGNGHMIPHGSLRECPEDALGRADVVVLHHANFVIPAEKERLLAWIRTVCEKLQNGEKSSYIIATSEIVVKMLHDPFSGVDSTSQHDLERFRGQNVLVFCGVGNPESVERVVHNMGCWNRVHIESFPDHHPFTYEDIDDVRNRAYHFNAGIVLTTEKDFARSSSLIRRVFGESSSISHKQKPSIVFRVLICNFELTSGNNEVRNRVKSLLRFVN